MKSKTLTCIISTIVFATLLLPTRPAAQVGGSGTPGNVAVWTGSTTPSNTLANSTIIQTPATSTTSTGIQVNSGRGRNALCRGIVGDGVQCISGTAGGSIQINAASGGLSTCFSAAICGKAGNGGSISLQPGGAGFGSGTLAGKSGNVILVPNFGRVGVGVVPGHTLEVKIGGTTLADAWTTRSSRRFKSNIRPLRGALEKIEQLQAVSYQQKDNGRNDIGLLAEDVARVVPEIVAVDPNTGEAEGVDYSRIAALLIEAVKNQQAQISNLKVQLHKVQVEYVQSTRPR